MKYLLDTHLLLWAASQPDRLPPRARSLIEDEQNSLWFSAASLWEISIKKSLGRDDFRIEPRLFRRGLIDNGYEELPVTSEHAIATESLPMHHKDPFDRILVAQALTEGVSLLTADPLVGRYSGPVILF